VTVKRGLLLAAIECALVLSLSGKLLWDRATCPRVWVRAMQWDPNLPLRGRYLALTLAPAMGDRDYERMTGKRVLFFVPEKMQGLRNSSAVRRCGRRSRCRRRVPRDRFGWR